MDNIKTSQKCCENCKYFVLYYTNYRGRYLPMAFGHCICGKVLSNKQKRIFCNQVCEHWEDDKDKKQAKMDSIEHALCKMANELNQFLQYISEERRQ